ncbi:hypothetical protein ACWIGW_34845 [Nocardia brasiliensis]
MSDCPREPGPAKHCRSSGTGARIANASFTHRGVTGTHDGRNVIPGRWTFQVVEEYDDTYYHRFRDWEAQARRFTGGQRHLHEAELKRQRRTDGHTAHEATPAESAAD